MEIPTRIIEGLTMAEQYAAEAEREAAEIHRLGDPTVLDELWKKSEYVYGVFEELERFQSWLLVDQTDKFDRLNSLAEELERIVEDEDMRWIEWSTVRKYQRVGVCTQFKDLSKTLKEARELSERVREYHKAILGVIQSLE
ncbi:hypothetical protein IKE71_02725 [Candidatus Saccharibacteria bacterium]|nr:hypothetical protein [Candidatus Saccharibacteria bacterium]